MKPFVLALSVIALLPSNQTVRARQPQDVEFLSVQALNIGDDRVIAFDLKAAHGSIRSFPNVPRGWFISITNDASGATELNGNAQVGAAALNASFFNKFAAIQGQSADTPASDISLEIVVTKDFATERHIDVPHSDLLFSKSPK